MPSFPRDAGCRCNPEARPDLDRDWERLLGKLPGGLEDLALQTRAIVRRRVIRSGQGLLRLVLVYALGTFSLRDAAAWSARALGIALTEDALGYRFVHALALLQTLVVGMLAERLRAAPGAMLRLIDATTLNEPGSTGTQWRLHLTYSPTEGLITGAELTGAEGGESLSRAGATAEDVLVGDAGYGHASDVRVAIERRFRCLLRVHLMNLAVASATHQRLAPLALVREADKGVVERDVVLTETGYQPVPVRILVVPLPPEQAARARQRLRKRAKKKGKAPNKLAVRLAGYFCCVTTLSRAQASVETLLCCYRIRWQVELLFKRCKSVLHLDRLTKARSTLVRVQVWARLLVALLTERKARGTRNAAHDKPGAPPPSPWRLMRIHLQDIILAVYGGRSLDDRLAAAEATAERLREHSRRRKPWPAQLSKEIAALPRASPSWA